MKLWKPRSVTYKTHLFSALSRSIFTNACWIFATSLFIKVVGSKGYSQLYFYSSLTSLAYYVYFSVRGHKGKEPYNVYKAVMVAAVIASVGCFLEPNTAALKPYNELLLYLFVVLVMTVDLIGTTLGPMVLQASVNPAIFRQVYQGLMTQEVIARICAASLVWFLSQGHLLVYLYPFAWLTIIIHFVLFDITVWRMRVVELKTRIPEESPKPASESLSESVRFVFANPLVRAAMSVMVWSTLTKFMMENVFYQAADVQFHSARQLAGFVSVMSIAIYLLSLVLHHPIGRIVNRRMQLGTLLSIQPVNILLFGALALIVPPFWPMVLLMVTYNIIHRSIQLPISRQCLVPVPRQRGSRIVSLISIVISIATMMTAGCMAVLKDTLHFRGFLLVFLLLGSAIFFVITSLDSYYIRNLWSFFKEGRSGNWRDDPQLEGLSAVALDLGSTEAEVPAADIRSNPILNSYAFSSDRTALKSATKEHRRLLGSDQPEELLSGLQICSVAGFPWFARSVAWAISSPHPEITRFAQMAALVDQQFKAMPGFSSVFRRKIRAVAIQIAQPPGQLESESKQLIQLRSLLNYPDRKSAELFVTALADGRFKGETELLLSCISDGGSAISVAPIVERMYQLSYSDAQLYRQLLEQLSFGRKSPELHAVIESNLSSFKGTELALSGENQASNSNLLQQFMHTLYLEEYRLSGGQVESALSQTIGEFQILSADESAVLIDMHLSFLKKSDLFNTWQEVLQA